MTGCPFSSYRIAGTRCVASATACTIGKACARCHEPLAQSRQLDWGPAQDINVGGMQGPAGERGPD